MTAVQEFIEHYGVKGMKWGRRKGRSSSTDSESSTSTKPKAKDLSDEDLRKAVSRMQLERQYNDLTNAKSKNAGAEFVKSIGMTVAKTAITGLATQQVNAAMKKAKITK